MRCALLQLNVSDDPAANLEQALAYCDAAVAQGAAFILTPEVTNCISPDHDHQRAVLQAQDDDQTLAGLRTFAVTQGVHVLIGSLSLQTDDPQGRFANRSFLIGPDGAILAWYDKIHMFDVDLAQGETYRESDRFRPGDRMVVADTPIAQIGMAICYDMRFPALSQALGQAGAEILTYPSAFSRVSGAAHWETLLRARAIETGCWVMAPAQTGVHPTHAATPRATWGHSLVVDPWGRVVLDAGDAPGVYAFDLDIGLVAEARSRIPALKNARRFTGP